MDDLQRRSYLDAVENYKRVRQFIEHENNLTNYRQTWHATIQAGLFLAFFGILQKTVELDADGGWTYASYWIIMLPIALLGMAVSLVIATAINAANISVSRLETWWYRTYKSGVSVEQDVNPNIDPLSAHPPINGIFTGGVQTGYEPRMIPHFVLWCWVFLLVCTCPWRSLFPPIFRLNWYQSVSLALLVAILMLRLGKVFELMLKYYRENFLRVDDKRCVFDPNKTP